MANIPLLKERVLEFVSDIRKDLVKHGRAGDQISANWRPSTNGAGQTSNAAIGSAFREMTHTLTELNSNFMANYDSEYKVQAIIYRDQLVDALGPEYKSSPSIHAPPSMYEHPTNPLGVRAIADDLEHRARFLGN